MISKEDSSRQEIKKKYQDRGRKIRRWTAAGLLGPGLVAIASASSSFVNNPYQSHPTVTQYNQRVEERDQIKRSIDYIKEKRNPPLYKPESLRDLVERTVASHSSGLDSLEDAYSRMLIEKNKEIKGLESDGFVQKRRDWNDNRKKISEVGMLGGIAAMMASAVAGIYCTMRNYEKKDEERKALENKK